MPTTPFKTKAAIIAEIMADIDWEFSDPDIWQGFVYSNNLGLPLAYAYDRGIVPKTKELEELVNDTWQNLLTKMQVEDGKYYVFSDLEDAQED